MGMELSWVEGERYGRRQWKAVVDGGLVGHVSELNGFFQGHSQREPRYGWLTRPCGTLVEAQGELVALLEGRRERWVRPDTRFKRRLPNRPE